MNRLRTQYVYTERTKRHSHGTCCSSCHVAMNCSVMLLRVLQTRATAARNKLGLRQFKPGNRYNTTSDKPAHASRLPLAKRGHPRLCRTSPKSNNVVSYLMQPHLRTSIGPCHPSTAPRFKHTYLLHQSIHAAPACGLHIRIKPAAPKVRLLCKPHGPTNSELQRASPL